MLAAVVMPFCSALRLTTGKLTQSMGLLTGIQQHQRNAASGNHTLQVLETSVHQQDPQILNGLTVLIVTLVSQSYSFPDKQAILNGVIVFLPNSTIYRTATVTVRHHSDAITESEAAANVSAAILGSSSKSPLKLVPNRKRNLAALWGNQSHFRARHCINVSGPDEIRHSIEK